MRTIWAWLANLVIDRRVEYGQVRDGDHTHFGSCNPCHGEVGVYTNSLDQARAWALYHASTHRLAWARQRPLESEGHS